MPMFFDMLTGPTIEELVKQMNKPSNFNPFCLGDLGPNGKKTNNSSSKSSSPSKGNRN